MESGGKKGYTPAGLCKNSPTESLGATRYTLVIPTALGTGVEWPCDSRGQSQASHTSVPQQAAWQSPRALVHSTKGHQMAASTHQRPTTLQWGRGWVGRHSQGALTHPRALTEEGTTVESDGCLACHLSSIKDSIVELVREGEGLWTAEGAL